MQSDDTSLTFRVAPRCTVQELIKADRQFAGFGQKVELHSKGRYVPASSYLHDGPLGSPYTLAVRPKSQAKPCPSGLIVVIVFGPDVTYQVQLPAGSFLFQALPANPTCSRLQGRDALTGASLALDSRVWRPTTVDIRPLFWPADAAGTSDAAVARALQHFVQPLLQPSTCVMSPTCASFLAAAVQAGLLPYVPAFLPCSHVQSILVVVCLQGHWSLLHLWVQDIDCVQGVCYDQDADTFQVTISSLYEAIAMLWRKHALPLQWKCLTPPGHARACGPTAVAHATCVAGGFQHMSPELLRDVEQFLAGLPAHLATSVGHGRLSDDDRAALRHILLDKGVPEAKVDERICLAVEKLGPTAAAEAVQAKNPWQALKSVASRPGCNFRWVQADELELHIAHRANQLHGTALPKAKAKKAKGNDRKTVRAPLQVDPQQLQLVAGSFVAGSQNQLCQLSFNEVTPQARGLAFCTVAQMEPFLSQYRALSVEALGLMATSIVPDTAAAGVPISTVRYPAIYTPTGEGIILTGSLLQLGDEEVHLSQEDIAEVEQVETKVVKVALYRDEMALSWDSVTQAPVRQLLQAVSELSLCRSPHCSGDCGKFHAAVEEVVENVILDVWGRQWQKLEGGKADPASSAVFVAFLRVPGTAVALLQKTSYPGIYFEPRSSSWLPASTLQSARHAYQTCDAAVALARLGRKYGVRVKECDEASTFERLRPQHEFVKVHMTARYRLFPLPFGFQRKGVLQLLKRWGWIARPLQPSKGDATGTAWEVGAATAPPAPTMPLGESYVLITKIKELQGPAAKPGVCASARTRKHILYDDNDAASVDNDPWSNGRDPWSKAKPAVDGLAAASQPPSTAASKLEQISSDLRKDMHQIVKDHVSSSSSSSVTEDRLQKLEVGLGEVKMQNQKFESWFATFGGKVSAQSDELKGLSGVVQSQKQEINSLRGEVQNTVSTAVQSLQTDLTQQLSAQLAGQLEQIQQMFHKKQRQE